MPAGAAEVLAVVGDRAGTVVAVDGRIAHVDLDDALSERGVELGALAKSDLGQAALGPAAEPTDVFVDLNEAFSLEPVLVSVPAGVSVDGPVVVVNWVGGEGLAVSPRLVVDVGEGSEVTVLEYSGSDDAMSCLTIPVTELRVAPGASVEYLVVQRLGGSAWQIGRQISEVGEAGRLHSSQVALGGEYARLRVDSRLVGRGATGELLAAFFGSGDQTLDFRSFQEHVAPDTTSNLLTKGAVAGRSRSVYTGLIHVGPDAAGSDALQTIRNLKLSDDAWAESVPNLEIENNDVHCSHASAVGPVDEDQRFYLESRGVATEEADRLIVAGFFEEVIERLPVPAVRQMLREAIAAELGEGSS